MEYSNFRITNQLNMFRYICRKQYERLILSKTNQIIINKHNLKRNKQRQAKEYQHVETLFFPNLCEKCMSKKFVILPGKFQIAKIDYMIELISFIKKLILIPYPTTFFFPQEKSFRFNIQAILRFASFNERPYVIQHMIAQHNNQINLKKIFQRVSRPKKSTAHVITNLNLIKQQNKSTKKVKEFNSILIIFDKHETSLNRQSRADQLIKIQEEVKSQTYSKIIQRKSFISKPKTGGRTFRVIPRG